MSFLGFCHHTLDIFFAHEAYRSYGKIPIFLVCAGYKEEQQNGCEMITALRDYRYNPCITCHESKVQQLHRLCKNIGLSDYLIESVDASTDRPSAKISDVETTIFKRYRVSSMGELYKMESFPADEFVAEANISSSFRHALTSICSRYNVDFASVYNGRFSPYKSILRFLNEKNIPTAIHERGKSEGSFIFLKGISVEHTDSITEALNNISSSYFLKNEQVNRLSEQLEKQRKGKGTNALQNFTEKFEIGDKQNLYSDDYIVYFTSGLEEKMSSSCDFSVNNLCNDIDAFRAYATSINKRLVIRHHPNLAALGDNRENVIILNSVNERFSSYKDVIIYAPDSPMNSYLLAKNAFISVAPNSSLYYQLNLSGIPCLKSTDSIYLNLDSGIRTYITGNISSIRCALKRTHDPVLTKLFIEELQRVIFTYLFRWSLVIPGFKFNAVDPGINYQEYLQNGSALISNAIKHVLTDLQPNGPIVLN